jgi:hypothetical protein
MTGQQIFEHIADLLIKTGATQREKSTVLNGVMDAYGVFPMALERYAGDAVIVELFKYRGVRFVTDEDKA